MNSIFLILALLAPAQDGVRYPAKPGPREFILDEAKLLSPGDAAEIRNLCDEALTRKKAPIIVVTIPSLASHGATGWPIERYAMNLMGEWGVGWEDWNYGILLLVSPGDRKARIELGASWARRKDDESRRVMSDRIIPQFKRGDFSKGILEGVKGLHSLAIGNVPSATQPRTGVPAPIPGIPSSGVGCLPAGGCGLIVLIVGGLIVVMAISRMFHGGTSSWGNGGPGFFGGGYGGGGGFGSGFGGGLLGGALGSMLYDSFAHRGGSSSSTPFFGGDGGSSSSSSDSSFGGGSFGGGFSGGGGATGEW